MDEVVAALAEQPVGVCVAEDLVGEARAGDAFDAGIGVASGVTAGERKRRKVGVDRCTRCAVGHDVVCARAAKDLVGACTAVEPVVAVAAVDDVVAAAALDEVVAALAEQPVGVRVAEELVGKAGAGDAFNVREHVASCIAAGERVRLQVEIDARGRGAVRRDVEEAVAAVDVVRARAAVEPVVAVAALDVVVAAAALDEVCAAVAD